MSTGQTPEQAITKLEKHKPVDNSNAIIRGFWERKINFKENKPTVDAGSLALDIVKNAEKNVYIYSPKITNPELKIELERQHKRGLSIYALTPSIENHKSIWNFGVMREKKDITSSFILADPNADRPAGLWFTGEFTSKSNNTHFVLDLDVTQVKETWAHFCYYFWQSAGNELINGKIWNTMDLKTGCPKVGSFLPNTFRLEGLEQYLLDTTIDEMWISKDVPKTVIKYHTDPEDIVVEVGERMKKDLNYTSLSEKKVYGASYLPFSLLRTGNKEYVFKPDIGFVCNADQKRRIIKDFPSQSWPLSYHTEKAISSIDGAVILTDDNWDALSPRTIEESVHVPLESIRASSIEEWRNPPEPKPNDKLYLARSIEYSWSVEPPYAPPSAREDKLYQRWNDFESKFKKQVKECLEEVRRAISRENRYPKILAVFIAKSSSWKEWEKELESFLEKDWKKEYDRANVIAAIEKLEDINQNLKKDVSELNERNKKKDDEDESEQKTTEKKSKAEKNKDKDEEDALEAFYNMPKSKNSLKSIVPEKTLPSIGTLYDDSGRKYLAIKNIRDLEEANRIKNKYQAKIVAMKGG